MNDNQYIERIIDLWNTVTLTKKAQLPLIWLLTDINRILDTHFNYLFSSAQATSIFYITETRYFGS